MKKIISVLALSSLAFGVALADVKIATSYRTQATAFSRVMSMAEKDGVYRGDTAAKGELWNTYLLHQSKGVGDASDAFELSAKNDFAGVTVQINPYAYASKKSIGTGGNLSFKKYNGYVKLGGLSLNAGLWADGVMAGNYQVGKKDSDGANMLGADFLTFKMGSFYAKAITLNVTDITGFAGSTAPSAYLEYKGSAGDAKLTGRLSAISLGNNTWDGNDIYSGFAAQLDAKLSSFDAEFTFKQASMKGSQAERALSLYVQPLGIENIDMSFGGALGFYNGHLAEYNAEFRMRYASGPLSVSFINNLAHVDSDDYKARVTKATDRDYKSHVGAEYLASGKTATFVKNNVASTAMWNALGIFLKVNDTFKPFITMGDIVGFKSACLARNQGNNTEENFGDYGVEFFVNPGIQIYAASNASITAGCRIGWSNLLLHSDRYEDYGHEMSIIVPVIMRVKL